MVRKGPPQLQALRRVALRSTLPSRYSLRADRGWRDRFGALSAAGGDGLLCTAETVAALLDVCGDAAGGDAV
eukprot:3765301-Prymnesium_polylepis.1